MTSPTPSPTYQMPLIAPPPAGTAPDAYYADVVARTGLTLAPADAEGLGVTMSGADAPSLATLYAMARGSIWFFQGEQPRPPAQDLPSGDGLLLLQVASDAVLAFRQAVPGVVPASAISYSHVDAGSVRAAIAPSITALAAKRTEAELRALLAVPDTGQTKAELEALYLQRFLHGELSVWVETGTVLGRAASGPADGQVTCRLHVFARGQAISPVRRLRNLPALADPRCAGHPLADPGRLPADPEPVQMYLRFETWDRSSGLTPSYLALPKDTVVDVVDDDILGAGTVRDWGTLDDDGRVQFEFSPADLAKDNDLYFVVHTNGQEFPAGSGQCLPQTWSTKGWLAADGRTPGYYPNFTGGRIGSPTAPVTFRVGLDFHVALTYRKPPDIEPAGVDHSAPTGIPVTLVYADTSAGPRQVTARTNDQGEIHGVVFDARAGENTYFLVRFRIDDDNSPASGANVVMPQEYWSSYAFSADNTALPRNNLTTITDTPTTPYPLRLTAGDRNAALYILKVACEVATFVSGLAGADFHGIKGLTYYRGALFNRGYAWPVGTIHIPADELFSRASIAHETAHEIMWREVNYSSLGIAYEAQIPFLGDWYIHHRARFLSNTEFALVEGWTEFLEQVFAYEEFKPDPPMPADHNRPWELDTLPMLNWWGTDIGMLANAPRNTGESIEGAFANALWVILCKYVRRLPVLPTRKPPDVPETATGNAMDSAPWIADPQTGERFRRMIFNPLQELAPDPNPTTTALLWKIRDASGADWPAIAADLQHWDIAWPATLAEVTPATGPAAGGITITITGEGIAQGAKVRVAGIAATGASAAKNGTSITATLPPGKEGPADIVVDNPGGETTLSGHFTYTS